MNETGTPHSERKRHNKCSVSGYEIRGPRQFSQTSEEYQALLDGKVDAIVQGSAGLDYYSAHEGKGLVKMVGPEFNKNDVGFVFPNNSMLRKKVNGALLSMREDGTYQQIYDKWFGAR